MSAQATARTLPAPSAPVREERIRGLRVVEAPHARRRPKLAYALVALAGAALIAAAQIGLTLATTHDSFVLSDLKQQQRALGLEEQALREGLAGMNSPQALATKASELGMVVAGSASYLRLSDGLVAGAGSGADWVSTVNPNGPGAVANSLLVEEVVAPPTDTGSGAAADQAPVQSDTPPSLTEGLPIPSTH